MEKKHKSEGKRHISYLPYTQNAAEPSALNIEPVNGLQHILEEIDSQLRLARMVSERMPCSDARQMTYMIDQLHRGVSDTQRMITEMIINRHL